MGPSYHRHVGVAASPGIAIGKAFTHAEVRPRVPQRRISSSRVKAETERFTEALNSVGDAVRRTRDRVEIEHGPDLAQIFEAQLAMLADVEVRDRTLGIVSKRLWPAERAFAEVMSELCAKFEQIENEYLRARVGDLRDIEQQVQNQLSGGALPGLQTLRSNTVMIARDLLPSEVAQLGRRLVTGLVIDVGGATSHTSIIARSLGLPTVVGTENASRRIKSGSRVIVDGDEGVVHTLPTAPVLRYFRRERRRQLRRERELSERRDLPSVTADDKKVQLCANIDLPQEVDVAVANGAEGVGMCRTEFLYLGQRLPDEQQQYESYRTIVEAIAPQPVVIRTLDLGGDKLSHAVDSLPEANPMLGWRGIRICLDTPDLFKTQIRAILRAATAGTARILLPMVSSLDEVDRARAVISESAAELAAAGIEHRDDIELGVMIEVPSAAIMAGQFASQVDFFSLGTNDLVQYTLAVDRGTARVASLYDPLHPAVLQLIRQVGEAAREAGIPAGICGEMASDPEAAVVLMGLGIMQLSVSPTALPELKEVVRATRLADAIDLADKSLHLTSGAQVRCLVQERVGEALRVARPRRREGGMP
ncbi:MAG: phosphoenolpyruvate--protein phosphotransferase [Gemmatimonadaceae bacterium]|nr:phosphoenolpyruvate--protein phosphotransferase [Gemmatimonadaceae bacterium]